MNLKLFSVIIVIVIIGIFYLILSQISFPSEDQGILYAEDQTVVSGVPNPSFELLRTGTDLPQGWFYGTLSYPNSDDEIWDKNEFSLVNGYTGNALKADLSQIDYFHQVKSKLFTLENKKHTLTFYVKPDMIGTDTDSGFVFEIFIMDSSNELIVDWAIIINNDNIRKEEWSGADILDIDVGWEDAGDGWKKVNVDLLNNVPDNSKIRLYLNEYDDGDYTGTILIDEISFEVV